LGSVGVTVAVLAVGGLLGVVRYIMLRQQARRTQEMQSVAGQLGWQFAPAASFDSIPAVREFHLFSRGRHRHIRNLMSGRRGEHHVAVFDYQYTVGSANSRRTHRQTVVHVHTPGMRIPRFELRPEQVFHRVGSMLGYQDIDLKRHPEFSRNYLLRGPDEEAVRAVFKSDVVDLFERDAGISAEASGPDLFFWRNSRADGRELPALMDDALALVSRLELVIRNR
jgi:carbonic anhydrase